MSWENARRIRFSSGKLLISVAVIAGWLGAVTQAYRLGGQNAAFVCTILSAMPVLLIFVEMSRWEENSGRAYFYLALAIAMGACAVVTWSRAIDMSYYRAKTKAAKMTRELPSSSMRVDMQRESESGHFVFWVYGFAQSDDELRQAKTFVKARGWVVKWNVEVHRRRFEPARDD